MIRLEVELLIEKLNEDPILGRLANYALDCGIDLLPHPKSGEMTGTGRFAWIFFDCSVKLGGFFIFIPFDKEKRVIIGDSIARQIFCFAHELGHYRLRNNLVHRQIAGQCQIWRDHAEKNCEDACLLKEIYANLEAMLILRKICQMAVKNRGWRINLLNLWWQCPACLKAISENTCPKKQAVTRALNGLAGAVKFCEKEISRQMAETKNQP